MIGEFSYEELLTPDSLSSDRYRVDLSPDAWYEFRAGRGAYGSWFVDPNTIRRGDRTGGDRAADDALRFVADAAVRLGIGGQTAGHLIAELSSTLLADCRAAARAPSAAELADLPYSQVETHQTGHPWLVPNKGRIGFSVSDTERYAPEAGRPVRLVWVAVDRQLATYSAVDDLPSDRLIRTELDEATVTAFGDVLHERGCDPDRYLWTPVHPWQWDRMLAPLFAGQIDDGAIVRLGESPDLYLPQQSIRTFSNLSSPDRHHVKLPLSILNTLVWRGLPSERTEAAPAVTAWMHDLRDRDPFLRDETRPILLGEVASVGVRHELLESIAEVPYQYRELFGAIWREPLASKLESGERARTLAALLYVDPSGRSLVEELVRRSGLTPIDWLRRLFSALLPPLLHFLYRYGVVFSPHGENAIVVYDESEVPTRLAIKDFVDDVNISAHRLPGMAEPSEDITEILLREPPDGLCQFLHAGLFIGVFRYLAELCRRRFDLPGEAFWAAVREEIDTYQRRFADDESMRERFRVFDLTRPTIDRLCLNRNRLLLDGYRDRPERPHAAVHGTVPNPLA